MKMPHIKTAPLFLLLLSLASEVCLSAAPSAVTLEFGKAGVGKIFWNGKDYGGDGTIAVEAALMADGTDGRGNLLKYEVEPAQRKVKADYEGVNVSCTYAVDGNRVDLFVEATNKTKQPIVQIRMKLGEILLSRDIKNKGASPVFGWLGIDNGTRIGFRRLAGEEADIALGNWELKDPVRLNVGEMTPAGGSPILLETPGKFQGSHPVINARFFANPGRPIRPGETDHYHVSVSFGAPNAGDEELCLGLYAHIRKDRPMTMRWPDRRAIGMLFLAQPATGWPTNPRGYVMGKAAENDVMTSDGLEEFGEALRTYADNSIEILKGQNAQGVIVWDLEGAEFPHVITYIGDPRSLPKMAPEMDKYADEFFKKFRDAGLRVGVTIRPTEIYEVPGQPGKWRHREVPDPVQTMSDKIACAKKRWGCSIFYLDSNVFNRDWLTNEQGEQMSGVPYLIPAAMIEELRKKHPDVLIVPETANVSYYSCSAPYASVNLRQMGTPPDVRAIYPEAFMLVSVNRPLLEQEWETYSRAVQGGDILLFLAWYQDPANELVKLLYEEAEFRKKGVPPQVRNANFGALVKLATADDVMFRYYAAEALGEGGNPKAGEILTGLLDDSNLLVRKSAIIALGKIRSAAQPELAERMVEIMKNGELGMLGPFAADTLGTMGTAARPAILDLLASGNPQFQTYAMRAVKVMRESDADIDKALVALLDSENISLREEAIRTLGKKRVKDAVPKIVQALGDPSEQISGTAVVALGEIGDPETVGPIVKLYDRTYQSVVTYWIRDAQDAALKKITGEKDSLEPEAWRASYGQ